MILQWITDNPILITAIATVILTAATIYYAWTNHKLWINNERQSTRPRKEEEIKHIIKPLLKQCELEIHYLTEKNYNWFSKRNILVDLFNTDLSKPVVFDEFIQKQGIKKSIEEHDILGSRLKNQYDDFYSFINTAEFRSKVSGWIIEFDKSGGKKTEKVDEGAINHFISLIMDYIGKNIDLEDNTLRTDDVSFLKKYEHELSEMKNQIEIKNYLGKIESIAGSLKENINLLVTSLNNIRLEYRKEGLSFGLD